jgi:hypothetical protein
MNVSKHTLARAAAMASSIGGKILSPLISVSTWLPERIGGPRSTPIARRKSGSRLP